MLGDDDPDGFSNVGELLKAKADDGVKVLMLVWNEMMSTDSMAGMMGTHDEDTRRFFEGTAVDCKLVSRGRTDGVIADVFVALWHFVVKGGSFMDTMYWDKSSMTSFKIIEKTSGNVLPSQYTTEPMAYYHIINAYEENDHIILDAPFNSKQSYDFMNMNLVKVQHKMYLPFIA